MPDESNATCKCFSLLQLKASGRLHWDMRIGTSLYWQKNFHQLSHRKAKEERLNPNERLESNQCTVEIDASFIGPCNIDGA